jgi:hypothetical protein
LVWYSSETSIQNREISLLAILEIIFAISLYWGIAFYYDFYLHIITSIFFIPFLLLKSEESIHYSLNIFAELFNSSPIKVLYVNNKLSYFISLFFSLLIVYIIFDIKVSYFIIVGGLLGIFFGDFLLVLFIAFLFKIMGTIKYINKGIKNISINWFLYCFVIDIKKIPEIVPNIEKDTRISNDIKLSYSFMNIKKETNNFNLLVRILIIPIFYLCTIFYRFSIKSTFWFYIPLLFLVKTPSVIEDNSQKVGEFLSSLYETYLAKLRFLLAIIVLGLFLLTYFNFLEFNELNTSFKSFLFLFYVDFSSLEIWKILQILIAVLTIIIFLWADSVRRPKVSNKVLLEKGLNFLSIFYLNILRNWISFFYFTSAFIYLSFYYNFLENSFIPNGIRNLFIYLNELILWIPFSLI